ncbi:MAG TPA: hypothetical protein VFB90_01735 [Dehalococcoidia bacterium]|nr:hypothetical protein [Dehalococcoidia bacterium]
MVTSPERRTASARRILDLSAYPKRVVLDSGESLTIRPLQPADRFELEQFFVGLPNHMRLRLHHAVTDPAIVAGWTSEIDLIHSLPLIALAGRRIVADTVLLREPASNPVGEIRMTVAERYERTDLAEMMLRDLAKIGEKLGLDAVILTLITDGDSLVEAARRVGFREIRFRRDDGTYISLLAITFSHLHREPESRPGLQLV